MATISIPIETKVREFDGKLWLAAILAQDGHTVVLGEKSKRYLLEDIHPDLHIAVSMAYTKKRYNFFSELNKTGVRVGILDTEGGVFQSKEDYFKNQISTDILELTDVIFAWGEEPANVIRNRTSYPDEQVHVTGNPRFDLLQSRLRKIYSESAQQMTDRIGNYILINTNFTGANPYDREKLNKILEKRNVNRDETKVQYQVELVGEFLEAVRSLSRSLANHTIVIRPHPSENHDFYREEFADISSVLVEHSGDARAWIYGADCVVHNGCTTGIESALLNIPVIAYEPQLDAQSYPRPHLPNRVSCSVTTVDELVKQVNKFVAQSEPYELSTSQKTKLKKYFENVTEPSAPKIAAAISRVDGIESTKFYPNLSTKRQFELWVKKQPVAPYIQRFRGSDMKKSGYQKQKFPGLTLDEVQSRLQDIEAQVGNMNLKVSRINYLDDIYCIEKQ